jgi:hypothetical protein
MSLTATETPLTETYLKIYTNKNVNVRLVVTSKLRKFLTIAFKFGHNVPLEYERFVNMYRTSISGEEAVAPETISESSSPIAFKFCHNVAFKYAHVFRYIGTSISGEEAGESETIRQHCCGSR